MDLHLHQLETPPPELRFDFIERVDVIAISAGPLCANRWREFLDSAELD